MAAKERIKRPTLDRTQPIRSWSTLFGVPPANGADGSDGAQSTGRDGASLQDVVSRSVDLGYRVVDEYIRRGQQAAQRFGERSYTPETMTNDLQEVSVRMAQHASDFVSIWFEMLQALASSGGSPFSNPAYDMWRSTAAPSARQSSSATGASKPPPAEAGEPARVKIEVVSARPTEVSLDLRPQPARRPLVVHALRAVDPDKPRLTEVTLRGESADEPVTLCIRVPDDQPTGVYNGLIIDEESSRPVGTVSVRVS